MTKNSTALLLASALAGGIAQGAIVYTSFTDTSLTNPAASFYRLHYPYPASSTPSEVMLLGFMMGPQWTGRDGSGNSTWDTNATWGVPCPYDPKSIGGAPATWWYDMLAKNAHLLATSGFTAIWLPSPAKGNMGSRGPYASPTWVSGGIFDPGYGLFDDYDLGDKLQQGNYQTRYGSREQLNRCLAMLRANGLSTHLDLVLNQRNSPNIANPSGPAYQWFAYKDAYGNPNGGRFPKYWPDFHPGSGPPAAHASPGCAEDPDVPATTFPDGSSTGKSEGFWGPDLAHICGQANINGVPGVWCDVQLKCWGDWLFRSLGVQGYRIDSAGGMSWDWLKGFVSYGAVNGKFVVAEMAGMPYNAYQMKDWMRQCMRQSGPNFTMFDQLLEPALGAMCNNNGFWMGALQSKFLSWGAGSGTNAMDPSAGSADPGALDIYRSLMSVNPSQVVSVINEVDTDTPVFGNPPSAVGPDRCLLGYAYIMTIGFGTPCVDWKDWSTGPGCYGGRAIQGQNLQYWLNNLIWCKRFVTTGGFGREQITSNGHVYSFERTGGSKALVFLNSNQGAAEKITFATSIPNGTQLQDYSGHSLSPVTVAGGAVVVTVPANVNGRGYLILAGPGKSGSFSPTRYSLTQQWEANADLSIPPASSARTEVCRVWVDSGQTLAASLVDYNTTNWTSGTQLVLEVAQSSLDNLNNTPVASQAFTSSMKGQALVVTNAAGAPGFYSLFITGTSLPGTGGPWWFKLQNTYTASQTAPTSFDDPGNCYH